MLRTVCVSILIIGALHSCKNASRNVKDDFSRIVGSDTLRIITLNTSTSYFIYRDQEMGYHYDMAKDFANSHGLQLQVVVAKSPAALIGMLREGEGDIIAYNVPVESAMKEHIRYSGLSGISHQVLVQRTEAGDTLLSDVTQLIGKEVYVLRDSKYEQRMKNLNQELGGGIGLQFADKDTLVEEDLIRMVSAGAIRFTVAEEQIAQLNHTYFRNIDIGLQISFEQRTSWAVRNDSPVLADSLDAWFARTNSEPIYMRLTKRYFEETKGFHEQNLSSFVRTLASGQLSPWDRYFKQYGKQFNIDWRLLASVSYFESTFNPDGLSWAGAGGLMGLMPATAASLGMAANELFVPEINIRTGAQYLRKLLNSFASINDESERIKMALASYNAGIGHILDARALAEKYAADKNRWEGNVQKYLQYKRLEQYYNDPVCRAGYFRSEETVNYVQNVMDLWHAYQQKL